MTEFINTEANLPEGEPDPAEVEAARPYEPSVDEEATFLGDPREVDDDSEVPEPTPPRLIRAGLTALAYAEDEHLHPSRSWYRDCLYFVRSCFAVPSYYSRAEYAYYGATYKHTMWPPPAATPVFWTDGSFGHVVISDGHGYCWSSDFLSAGRIDKVRIASITAAWGQHYRGWAEDINKVRVYHVDWWVLDVSNTIHAARYKRAIPKGSELKHVVAKEVGVGDMILKNDTLGTGFREQYHKVQVKYLHAMGLPVTKSSADGIPGRSSLTWLGNRHGFYVH